MTSVPVPFGAATGPLSCSSQRVRELPVVVGRGNSSRKERSATSFLCRVSLPSRMRQVDTRSASGGANTPALTPRQEAIDCSVLLLHLPGLHPSSGRTIGIQQADFTTTAGESSCDDEV